MACLRVTGESEAGEKVEKEFGVMRLANFWKRSKVGAVKPNPGDLENSW